MLGAILEMGLVMPIYLALSTELVPLRFGF